MKSLIQNLIITTKIVVIMIVMFFVCVPVANAQIEKLIVETWYVADANDATDTTEGRSLHEGMITYRIFLDLTPGSKLKKVFGSDIHPLRFSSTTDFYNNIDRPNAYFGYLINKSWYNSNPTLALDSWLTLGLTSTGYVGIPKTDDTDGSFIGGSNNSGGSSGVPGGLMVNTNPLSGIPVTTADGYMPNTNVLAQWFDQGFKGLNGDDTTVFGSVIIGNEFLSNNAILQQNNGVQGSDPDSNKVLIAQLTTAGSISFNLNVVIDVFDGTNYNEVTFVANGDSLLQGEFVSPFLTYPPACGCTDTDYLEYSPAYACNEIDSCQTLVVLGCNDTLACNYDPNVNLNVQALCCYPGLCDDRELQIVCPAISVSRFGIQSTFPNPASELLTMQYINSGEFETIFRIYNAVGQMVQIVNLGKLTGTTEIPVNISNLSKGIYQVVLSSGNETDSKTFIKTE